MKEWVDFRTAKEAVSLEAVLRHYQVKGRRRNQLEGCGPIHGGKREDSFRASLSKNVFPCFACQARGNILDFVAAMERCSIRQAALTLQQWFGWQEPGPARMTAPAPGKARKGELAREKEEPNPPRRFALTGLDHSHAYLRQRGIEPATAVGFGVGFYGREGLLSGRIVIPIHNARGQIVGYAGRAPDGRPPKYKLPTGFRKGRELFNLHRAARTGNKTVIVVEGYFDCLRVHQSGFPSAVALMGCSLPAEQESLLLGRFERVILMLDGDAAGRAASRAIRARLTKKCSVAAVEVPEGAQPDQLPVAAIQRLLQAALELIQKQSGSFETKR